jgi:hypothetical protein
MRPLAPVLAAVLAGLAPTAQAQVHTTRATGGNPAAAMQRAMQQEMRQQQQMIQQHQKAMQQQQKAMLQQHQKAMEQQQKAMLQQQKAMEQQKSATQHPKAMQPHTASGTTTGTPAPGAAGSPHEAQANHGVKAVHGATASHATGHHGASYASHRHWLRTWPSSSNASYRHLMALKQSLDAIARSATPSTSQRTALRTNLSRVIVNSPHPTTGHMQAISDHLSAALAGRGAPPVDTKSLALQLRAMMNVVHLPAAQADEALLEHRATLRNGGVPEPQVDTIAGDLRTVAFDLASKLP